MFGRFLALSLADALVMSVRRIGAPLSFPSALLPVAPMRGPPSSRTRLSAQRLVSKAQQPPTHPSLSLPGLQAQLLAADVLHDLLSEAACAPRRRCGDCAGLAACSGHRQIARSQHCSKTSVTRMAERLGRHAILFHARCRAELPPLTETIVHDHFEAFISRQDRALGVGTAVGSPSWFVYDVDPAPHRGSGRRPDRKPGGEVPQRAIRSYIRSIQRTLRSLIPHLVEGRPLFVNVDGRTDYRVAVQATDLKSQAVLRVYPNPKRGPKGTPRSPEATARDRAMFPVDQFHQLLRHSCSDHKRQTIAFGRRLESIMGRAHLIAVWKNFIKSRSERRPDRTTPAMRLGIANSRWSWDRLLSRRLFPGRERMSDSTRAIYRKCWIRSLPKLAVKHAA